MAKVFIKKKPLLLKLEDYRLIEKIINEIDEPELTPEEIELRKKVRLIQSNIEKAIKYSKEHNQNGERNQD